MKYLYVWNKVFKQFFFYGDTQIFKITLNLKSNIYLLLCFADLINVV